MYYIALSLNDELNSIGTGSTYTAISVDEVRNVNILYLSITDQQAIATYLDRKTTQIDTLIKKKEGLIEFLKEYRTSLISEAVTGKKDVREEINELH